MISIMRGNQRTDGAKTVNPITSEKLGPRRELHEHAAEVAQRVIDLEDRVTYYQRSAEEWERASHLAEGEALQFKRQYAEMRERSEYYQKRLVEIVTKLNTAASVILDCMDEEARSKAQRAYQQASAQAPAEAPAPASNAAEQMERSIAAVVDAIDKKDDDAPPKFLTERRDDKEAR